MKVAIMAVLLLLHAAQRLLLLCLPAALFTVLFGQLQLQNEAEERRLKEEEEKREKLRVLRERKEMERRVSCLFSGIDLAHNC